MWMSKPHLIALACAWIVGLLVWAPGANAVVRPVSDTASRAGPLDISAQDVSAQAKKPKQKASPGPSIPARQPFTAADQAAAAIPGIANARFWADTEQDYARALPQQRGAWLVLSTGGEDGAFGAGLLNGWSQTGKRPEFTMVTGVSTGALIAPFAFLGSAFDDRLRDAYTTINATDIFEIGGKGESLLDTWPLKDLIAKRVTPELLAAIAKEHARGRRLFILTTNLDAGRPVAWDIGAIASAGGEGALALVRQVMIAAISIPGAFPPVLINAEANGKKFQEMHVDGGLAGQFFVAPEALLTSMSQYRLPATDLYLIVNMKLTTDFQLTERTTLGILGRTVSAAIRFVTRNAIDRAYVATKRSDTTFNLAFVNSDFSAPSRGPFDSDYMKTLYEVGLARGKSDDAFTHQPPDFSDGPDRKAAQ